MQSELPEWKDATSYSRGEHGKRPPDAWDIVIEGIRVWVGSGHRYHPGKWVMHCHALDIDTYPLDGVLADDAGTARAKALEYAADNAKKRARTLINFAKQIEARE